MASLVFKEVVRIAARAEHVAGAITTTQLNTVLNATSNQQVCDAIECSVYDHMAAQGTLTAGDGSTVTQTAVNWQNIIAAIQALIPLILQIISLFK